MPSERSVAAVPGDVDADTVCVLSAASGPIAEAELVQIVGGDQAETRVFCHVAEARAMALSHNPWRRVPASTSRERYRSALEPSGRCPWSGALDRTCPGDSSIATPKGGIAPVARSEYVIRYGAMHFVRHDATAEELDRVIAEPMRAAWEPLDGGAFGFRALVVAAWRRSHAAFGEATSEASRGRCTGAGAAVANNLRAAHHFVRARSPGRGWRCHPRGIFRPGARHRTRQAAERERQAAAVEGGPARRVRGGCPGMANAIAARSRTRRRRDRGRRRDRDPLGIRARPQRLRIARVEMASCRESARDRRAPAYRRAAALPRAEEVLLLAARRLAGLHPERRAFWAALLAPLSSRSAAPSDSKTWTRRSPPCRSSEIASKC